MYPPLCLPAAEEVTSDKDTADDYFDPKQMDMMENPQDYQTLPVRVSGWNARFVTLDKDWQDMVIEQNER